MKPGIGTLDIFPSIWGREFINKFQVNTKLTGLTDWAGGPGDNPEDVEWLDNKLSQFFADNGGDEVNSLAEKLHSTLN